MMGFGGVWLLKETSLTPALSQREREIFIPLPLGGGRGRDALRVRQHGGDSLVRPNVRESFATT